MSIIKKLVWTAEDVEKVCDSVRSKVQVKQTFSGLEEAVMDVFDGCLDEGLPTRRDELKARYGMNDFHATVVYNIARNHYMKKLQGLT